MRKIKKILFLLFLLVGFQCSFGQEYKFQTTGFSVLEKLPNGKWGDWSKLENVNLLIKLDTNKNRIIVYSRDIQLYSIVQYEEKEENENDIIYPFTCTDGEGEPFVISIITRKNQNNRKQLYINQKEVILLYNIVNYIEKPGK